MGEFKTGQISLRSIKGENKNGSIQSCIQYRDVENFFSMSDIRSDKLRKFARPNENMPDRII